MISSIALSNTAEAANYLKYCCEKSGRVELKGVFATVDEAFIFLNANGIDLLFVDAELTETENGFDLLDLLFYKPTFILISSDSKYAHQAFEYNAIDFLKRPFSFPRFQTAIAKVFTSSFVHPHKTQQSEYFFIRSHGELIKLTDKDILYIESMGDYVKFVTADKNHISHNTIKQLEKTMNTCDFLKVHRSYIININKVTNIGDDSLHVGKHKVPVSKANRPEVMRRIKLL